MEKGRKGGGESSMSDLFQEDFMRGRSKIKTKKTRENRR